MSTGCGKIIGTRTAWGYATTGGFSRARRAMSSRRRRTSAFWRIMTLSRQSSSSYRVPTGKDLARTTRWTRSTRQGASSGSSTPNIMTRLSGWCIRTERILAISWWQKRECTTRTANGSLRSFSSCRNASTSPLRTLITCGCSDLSPNSCCTCG